MESTDDTAKGVNKEPTTYFEYRGETLESVYIPPDSYVVFNYCMIDKVVIETLASDAKLKEV